MEDVGSNGPHLDELPRAQVVKAVTGMMVKKRIRDPHSWPNCSAMVTRYPLVMTNIAMENGPFIDGLPIKNGAFPWLC